MKPNSQSTWFWMITLKKNGQLKERKETRVNPSNL